MTDSEEGQVRLAVLETKMTGFEKQMGDLAESIKWLTRAIFGLLVTLIIGGTITLVQIGLSGA